MRPRCSIAAKLLAISLLLLAISPITAPFSTCDLFHLLEGTAPPASAWAKAKQTDQQGDTVVTAVELKRPCDPQLPLLHACTHRGLPDRFFDLPLRL